MAGSPPKKSNGGVTLPLSHPRGTQDILPDQQKYWEYVVETTKSFLQGWNFQRIDTPLFEELVLFQRGLGQETDIVAKEIFELKSRGGSPYVLRPEGTASLVRAYIEHGMRAWSQPVKLFYIGPFFRYDRPQKGRWRQLHQFGVEVFGSTAAITDAQLIYITHLLFRRLGLEDYTVHINTLGEAVERGAYIKLLKDHYRRNRQKLCKDCKERFVTNPLRLLDCKEEKCQQLANTAPRLLDHLGEVSRQHFEAVLGILDKLAVPYEIKPALVRGLDYYTHTVWEFVPKTAPESAQSSLAGGGRYNGLVKALGGKDTPGVGFAAGIERIIDRLKEEGVELSLADRPQVFVAQLGARAKKESLDILRQLQEAQIPFAESLDRDGMQAQLRLADRVGVRWALIIGQKEVLDKTIIFRNMESGMQEVVPQDKMVSELQKRLSLQLGT
jgi:histidyl-tRNA synthetase